MSESAQKTIEPRSDAAHESKPEKEVLVFSSWIKLAAVEAGVTANNQASTFKLPLFDYPRVDFNLGGSLPPKDNSWV